MNPLVAVVGPTGVGKSRLALHLALVHSGEIIGADSRQLYRGMDIGTDKPAPSDMGFVPHHMIDIISPNEEYSQAQYHEAALDAIKGIHSRKKLPFLVGGSGLYVWSVLEGWQIPRVVPDADFRKRLEKEEGVELYRRLELADPEAASTIDPRNVRRVIRALEVKQASGTLQHTRGKKTPPFNTLIIGLTAEREELYRRIDSRVDEMIQRGLVSEVRMLLDKGYHAGLPAMSSIGYRQMGMFLRGEISLQEAVRQMKRETRRLVRQQYNWFRLTDKRIQWFDIGHDVAVKATELVDRYFGDIKYNQR